MPRAITPGQLFFMTQFIGSDIEQQTWIVLGWLLVFTLISVRARVDKEIFPSWLTQEIKGLAILSILFGHVGYFLISEHWFLVPLSNFSGIGVDLFMIMSGFGLAVSALSKPLSVLGFYKRRLLKVIVPVSLTVAVLTLLDFVVLHRSYPVALTIKNLLGFFPQADLYRDINSPLWFITPLLVYYIIFPLVAHKRAPYILPIAFLALGYVITQDQFLQMLPVTDGVRGLYRVHAYGFGLGTLLGMLLVQFKGLLVKTITSLQEELPRVLPVIRYVVLFTAAIAGLTYTLTHPQVGAGWKPEQLVSLYSSGLIILAMMLKPVEIRLWWLIGVFSFFIYLIHWPLFYRYDFLFNRLPSGIAMLSYIALFLVVGYAYTSIKNRNKTTTTITTQ